MEPLDAFRHFSPCMATSDEEHSSRVPPADVDLDSVFDLLAIAPLAPAAPLNAGGTLGRTALQEALLRGGASASLAAVDLGSISQ